MEIMASSSSPFGVVTEVSDESALFLTEERRMGQSRIGLRRSVMSPPSSESSSSLGLGVSEEEDEKDDAVSSRRGGRWLDSFTSSLEDSLPIKRGLSNHYIGKSKSFGNLMEATKKSNNVKELEKVESPLNKRRRLLIANKQRRRRRSSLSSLSIYSKMNHPNSMPLLALQESSDQDDQEHNDDYDDNSDDQTSKLQDKRMKISSNNNNREFTVHRHIDFVLPIVK